MEKLKIAIAGLGRIGKIHLDNLLEISDVEVVAATDVLSESLQYAKKRVLLLQHQLLKKC
jgi:myo-inositol 2-dehydrogenase/D-chiro-inositol 1-dehydrogenase